MNVIEKNWYVSKFQVSFNCYLYRVDTVDPMAKKLGGIGSSDESEQSWLKPELELRDFQLGS